MNITHKVAETINLNKKRRTKTIMKKQAEKCCS
jgi:hypothetical protein